MTQKKTDRMLLGISIMGFLMMSVSFMLLPVEAIKILPGVLFWLGSCVGLVSQVALEIRRRKHMKTAQSNLKRKQKRKIGLIVFCSNKPARITDAIMILSVVTTILVFVFTKGFGYICNLCIAITAFSVCLHCILNGRIYFHLQNTQKDTAQAKSKASKFSKKGEGEQ